MASAKWAYPFVVNEGRAYIITGETVDKQLIGKVVGKVTRYSSDETAYSGGNFSNEYPKGTKYFAIQGIASEEAIAIKNEKETYIKAVYQGEYSGGDDLYIVILRLVLIALAVVGILVATSKLLKWRKT